MYLCYVYNKKRTKKLYYAEKNYKIIHFLYIIYKIQFKVKKKKGCDELKIFR